MAGYKFYNSVRNIAIIEDALSTLPGYKYGNAVLQKAYIGNGVKVLSVKPFKKQLGDEEKY